MRNPLNALSPEETVLWGWRERICHRNHSQPGRKRFGARGAAAKDGGWGWGGVGWGGSKGEKEYRDLVWSGGGRCLWFHKWGSLTRGTPESRSAVAKESEVRTTTCLPKHIWADQSHSLGRGRIAFPLTCGLSEHFIFLEAWVQRCAGRLPPSDLGREGVCLNLTARPPQRPSPAVSEGLGFSRFCRKR